MTCGDGNDILTYEGLFMDGENVRRKYDYARRSSDIYWLVEVVFARTRILLGQRISLYLLTMSSYRLLIWFIRFHFVKHRYSVFQGIL